jgi:hypothetical protein
VEFLPDFLETNLLGHFAPLDAELAVELLEKLVLVPLEQVVNQTSSAKTNHLEKNHFPKAVTRVPLLELRGAAKTGLEGWVWVNSDLA